MRPDQSPMDNDRNINASTTNADLQSCNINTSTTNDSISTKWNKAIKRHCGTATELKNPPLKLGPYHEYYNHLYNEYYDECSGDDFIIHQSILFRIEQLKDKISYSKFISIFKQIKDYLNFQIHPFTRFTFSPDAPQRPENMNILTFTKYHYGIITFTTEYLKITEEHAIQYLREIYQRYLQPKKNYPRDWKHFLCNAWIEAELKDDGGRYIHMHAFYKRKDAHFFTGRGWLKKNKSTLRYNINVKACKTDAHIMNQMNYAYNDTTSILIEEFPKQILSVE